MMLTGPYNATRHPQKPLPQPAYSFGSVPPAVRDLQNSSLHAIDNREHFHESMAEMLLLCKEAMRRRRPSSNSGCSGGSKPLSLEYLADRLDIDDPCFGYLVRTRDRPLGRRDKNWSPGMLQGFITCTTFTNWQRTFRWDSDNEAAYDCDTDEHSDPARQRDGDGSLARELQASVHCGDINMEGIVWPHIAEISLLGALGCGRTLIELVIEELECMKPTAKANYDYVVLQATDNSIPFYESMGFVRVGAVMLDETESATCSDGEDDAKPSALENGFVTSNIFSYTVKPGETLTRIALKFGVDVWDIIFLNKYILGDEAKPCDRPLKNIILLIPAPPSPELEEKNRTAPREEIQWHVAKENDTARSIAKQYDLKFEDVVNANKARLPGLTASARLKEGTRVRISHLHIPENDYRAYAHWSFPDREFEEPEPSYMMARKLHRRKQKDRNIRPIVESLKTSIVGYEPTPLLLPASPPPTMPVAAANPAAKSTVKRQRHPDEPKPPNRPLTAYTTFASEQRALGQDDCKPENAKAIRALWNNLPKEVKAVYEREAATAKAIYLQEKAQYEKDLAAFYDSHPGYAQHMENMALLPPSTAEQSIKFSLYNKVVRLKEDAITEQTNYTYWYVLTFIPDLKWCHLAPMIQDGTFGADKPRVEGRPKWRLVDESLGHEVDISSSFVIPIRSKSMRKTLDADKEEWDIIDDGTDPTKPVITPRVIATEPSDDDSNRPTSGRRGTVTTKPRVARESRKKSLVTAGAVAESPNLLATLPGSGLLTTVHLVGKNIFVASRDEDARKAARSSGELASISERTASPKRQSTIVRFGSPSHGAVSQSIKTVFSPSSILRKGGRKRKTDGPHIGSCERQKKRRRMTEAFLRDAELSNSSDDDEDADMSDASSFSGDDEEEETTAVAIRSSPRLNRYKLTGDDGSPSTRTRRSLSTSCLSGTSRADGIDDDELVNVAPPTRSRRAKPDVRSSPKRRSLRPTSPSKDNEDSSFSTGLSREKDRNPDKPAVAPSRRTSRSTAQSPKRPLRSHSSGKSGAPSPSALRSRKPRSPDKAAVITDNILESKMRSRRSFGGKSAQTCATMTGSSPLKNVSSAENVSQNSKDVAPIKRSLLKERSESRSRKPRSPDKAAVTADNILESTMRSRRSLGQ